MGVEVARRRTTWSLGWMLTSSTGRENMKTKRLSLVAIATALGFCMGTAIISPEVALARHVAINKWDVRGHLEADNWTVLYSEEFGTDNWVKLTATLSADALGCARACTSAFIKSFGYQSYDIILGEISRKSPNLVGSFGSAMSKTAFGSLLVSAIRNGRVESRNLPGVRLDVGKVTYNRKECTRILGRDRCVPLPNSHQPYVRVKFLAGR